jgi:hypothetical protein
MPFVLTNAPATFHSLVNHIFEAQLRKFVLVFFDDILIYSRTMADHIAHLHQVLSILRANKLTTKESKCIFATHRVEYLGHVITVVGVSTDPSKISAIQS